VTGELLLVMGLATAVAAFVQASTGLGFALIVAPVVGLIEPRLLPVVLLVLMIPLNSYVAWRERDALDTTGAWWISAGRAAGTAGGLWVLIAIPPSGLNILIGASTIVAVLASLLLPAFVPGTRSLLTVGAVTGVTETATGIGGPPLVLAYQHRPAPELRATVALCFLIGEVLSLALLWATGNITRDQLGVAAMLLPALMLGGLLSQAVHHRLEGSVMRGIVLGFALVSGVAVLFQG
jgi:uncharacterized membrane protein YfcA